MVEKLKIKAIYDDFIENVKLTKEQIEILDMLINKESIVKISLKLGISERTVGYEIRKIKNLYNDYCQMQLFRMLMLLE